MEARSGNGAGRKPAALEIRALSKSFPGTVALRDVSLTIEPGEIHALVGQNGSGKSTLIKVLAGYHEPKPGVEIFIHGAPVDPSHLASTKLNWGLRFVHQDLGLVDELSAVDNLALLGQFIRSRPVFGRIDWAAQRRSAEEALARFDVDIDVDAPLAEASPVEQTVVAIAAAVQDWESRSGILVLDEPTARLPLHEVETLLGIVQQIRARGASVLYVTHRLDELFGLVDRVSVLRGGRIVTTRKIEELTKDRLASLMVGEQFGTASETYAPERTTDDEVLCEMEGVSTHVLRDFSLSLRRGEIVGVTGLPGSGCRDVVYSLAGMLPDATGHVRFMQRAQGWDSISTPRPSLAPLVPADRKREAAIGPLTIGENLTLSMLDRLRTKLGTISDSRERQCVTTWIDRLEVDAPSLDAPITTLSGGNQQKIVLARCLALEPDVIGMCEPTAGVDVATRQAIFRFISSCAHSGLSVLVDSSDFDDLLAMCDRVLVMDRGRVIEELDSEQLSEAALIQATQGVTADGS